MTVGLSTVLNEELLNGGKTLGYKDHARKRAIPQKVGKNYMNSELARKLLPSFLHEMDQVDDCYSRLTAFLLDEANHSVSEQGRWRKTTSHKDYWDDELRVKWQYLRECERIFRNHAKKNLNRKEMITKNKTLKWHNGHLTSC